jgi:Tol biopolymer transport system component
MYPWRVGSTYVRTSILLLGFIWAATFAGALGHAAGPTALTAAHAIYLPLIQQALPGRLVFTATQNGISQIVTMHANGTGRTRLSDLTANDFEPTWSPDGTQIVFASDRNGGGIYLMHADGTNVRLLLAKPLMTDFFLSFGGPVWSPDGTRIAVGFYAHTQFQGAIYIVPVASPSTVKVIYQSQAILDSFAWSPDSTRIAFADNFFEDSLGGNMYVIGANGTGLKTLHQTIDNEAPYYDLAWSPDGAQILYTSGADADVDLRDIYVINADGSAARPLTSNAGYNFGATWSPDGRYIAFSSTRMGASRLFVMHADGSGQLPLIGSIAGDSTPAWHS